MKVANNKSRLFRIIYVLIAVSLVSNFASYSQYTTYTYGGAGYSNPSAGVYKMTDDNGVFQVSSVWNNASLDARNSFNLYFNIYLGCLDATGADGMGFVLSPTMGIGDGGANMGVYLNGGSNAPVMPNDIVLVEFDTWDNGGSYGDIPNDHIVANKYVNSFCCPALPPVDMGNMEDNLLHTVRMRYTPPPSEWDWDGGLLETFYYPVGTPCPAIPVFSYPVNIRMVTNSTTVYWGWAAATGGNKNEQWFSHNGTSTPPTYATSCTPLPLELLDFTVAKGRTNTEAIVNWTAISTDMNSRVELYRSTDAQNWKLIHNSEIRVENIYSDQIIDELTSDGIYYYKLEMIDVDNIRSVSDIKLISINTPSPFYNGIVKVYLPNDKQNITIQTSEKVNWDNYSLSITDITGNEVVSNIKLNNIDEHSAEIILPQYLAGGIYIFKCLSEGQLNAPEIHSIY